jgi:hypothetical protein
MGGWVMVVVVVVVVVVVLNIAPLCLPQSIALLNLLPYSWRNIRRCHRDAMDIYETNRLEIQWQGKGD